MKSSDQYTLNTISKFFIKNPIRNFSDKISLNSDMLNEKTTEQDFIYLVLMCIAEMHILAGNLLHSVDVLSLLLEQKNCFELKDKKNKVQDKANLSDSKNNAKQKQEGLSNSTIKILKNNGGILSPRSNKSMYNGRNSHENRSNIESYFSPYKSSSTATTSKALSRRESSLSSSNLVCAIESSKTLLTSNPSIVKRFEEMVDRIWNLVRFHPQRDVQTIALLLMLRVCFPIYHRLAADNRLCRMIESYLEGSGTTSRSNSPAAFFNGNTLTSSGGYANRSYGPCLSEMSIRERYVYLKRIKLVVFLNSQQQSTRLKILRQKCDQLATSQANRLRFYTDCSHYEKCIVESGTAKMQFAALRNRLRKCSRCVTRSRFSLGSHLSTGLTPKK